MVEHRTSRRLDQELVSRGLVATRSRARDLILRGFVYVDGRVEQRPARKVGEKLQIKVLDDAPQFVSRGAEKLTCALDHFAYDPSGLVGLDIGASTGGFTQVLLQRGAMRVVAVDVGSGQLHPTLSDDPRVTSFEQTDARRMTMGMIGAPVGCLVADLSFISLTKAIGQGLGLVEAGGFAVLLVKPQFEVGESLVGKGGVVRDAEARNKAVAGVRQWLTQQGGWEIDGVVQSPISGGSGNIEYLLGARKFAR